MLLSRKQTSFISLLLILRGIVVVVTCAPSKMAAVIGRNKLLVG